MRLGYIRKRIEIIQHLAKEPSVLLKALFWATIDTPRVLYKYSVWRYIAGFANKLMKDVRVRLDYGEFIVPDAHSLWILVHYEKHITSKLKTAFSRNPDLVFVDIGAHIGKYTVLAGRFLRRGFVIAFEPHPENFRYLVLNTRLNGINNAKLFQLALWNKVEQIKLFIASTSGEHTCKQASDRFIKVLAVPLDSIISRMNLQTIDVIKVDVEGAETEVIEGALNTLRKHKPHLIIEVKLCNLHHVLKYLSRLGYSIELLDVQRDHVYLYAHPRHREPLF